MSTHSSFTISEITELFNLVASVGGMSKVRQLLSGNSIPFTSIRAQTDHFEVVARQRGVNRVTVFNNVSSTEPVSPYKAPQGVFTPVDTVQGTTEASMRGSALWMTRSQAIQYMIDELETGTFDTPETHRMIFFRDQDGSEKALLCGRSSGGELHLLVNEVNPSYAWRDAGNAWLATNP